MQLIANKIFSNHYSKSQDAMGINSDA